MEINLVCEGGGVRGIAHVGAICALEELGYTFKSFAGTSVGAFVTSLMAAGYSGEELKDIIFSTDFNIYIHKTILSTLPLIGKNLSIIKSKGIFSTSAIEKLLDDLYLAKGKIYLKDICIDNYFKCIATDITKKQLLILPEDLSKYDIDWMNLPISKAVKMSISLPLIFIPEKLKTPNGNCYIIDGGVMSNFPIWLFDNSKDETPTFGLKLTADNYKTTYEDKYPLSNYLLDIIDLAIDNNDSIYFNNNSKFHIINIPTLNIGITDFSISLEDKKRLFKSGYNSIVNYFKNSSKVKYI